MLDNTPSSIGIAGEYTVDNVNNRLRMPMFDFSIDTVEQLHDILEDALIRLKKSGLDSYDRRLAIRFIGKNDIVTPDNIDRGGFGSIRIEAKKEFSGRLQGYSLCYLGYNAIGRYHPLSDKVKAYERSIINKVNQVAPSNYLDEKNKFGNKHPSYTIQILEDPSHDDISQVVKLYTSSYKNPRTGKVEYPFPLEHDNVKEMLTSDTNIVGIVRNEVSDIISIGIGEMMECRVAFPDKNEEVNVMEISDTATYIEYDDNGNIKNNLGGKGLNKMIVMDIIQSGLDQYGEKLDLVFGETRAALDSVNFLAQKTGRMYSGTLEDAVVINGLLASDIEPELAEAIRNHAYGDLNMMSLNYEELQKYYLTNKD